MSLPPERRVLSAPSEPRALGARSNSRIKVAPSEVRAAVALAYAENDPAPKVVAKGRGLVAHAIIDRARAAGVFVHDSPELVGLLMQVDLDRHIPAQLYVAVAEVLAWIYRLEQRAAPDQSQNVPHDGGIER
jgi:flagellar biosynthesis protein